MGTSENVRRLIKAPTLLILCTFVLLAESSMGSKPLYFKWEVEYLFWSPDCVENLVMGINGQFPGPTIRGKAGDTVVIELTNKLHTEGVVIHWHGIRQFGTPWADGTASISQCAINPGETFTYEFILDKPGTYFYHGHYGMQRSAGLYGALIVDEEHEKKEPFHYDGEFTMLLSDWWHESVHHQEVGLSSSPMRWIGEPQTLLINGRGQYQTNCSLAAHNSNADSSECKHCATETLPVHQNKTYRLRIASTTALASLNLAIENHTMEVVEADGNYVKPFVVKDLDIYSGESYSVLINTNQDPSRNYWVSIGVRGREPKTPQALTLLNYLRNSAALKIPTSSPPVTHQWDDYTHSKSFTNKVLALEGSPKPPKKSHRRIILLNTQQKINGYTKWAISNVSLTLPSTPILGSVWYGLNHTLTGGSGSGVYRLEMNKTVDIILQNANAHHGSVSEIHPWHLHGHDFWVLGYGEGEFSRKDRRKFNLKTPPLKNTAVLYPYGWTALRFVANNPGAWAFHCHIEPHLHMGMGVVFHEGVRHLKHIPKEALACGLTANLPMASNHN